MNKREREEVILQRNHAREMFEKFKLEEDEIRKDDFSGRIYVDSTLEIFRNKKYWEFTFNKLDKELKTESSKLLSLVLRHHPEKIGIQLNENGWAEVTTLLEKMNDFGHQIDLDLLKEIVSENDKKRFSFSEDLTQIRANQGHSIQEIDLQLKSQVPPQILYHGTALKNQDSIMNSRITKGNRQHVHLSTSIETAHNVGSRHSKAVIVLEIQAKKMYAEGFDFYLSDNKVWLTDNIPSSYISNVIYFK